MRRQELTPSTQLCPRGVDLQRCCASWQGTAGEGSDGAANLAKVLEDDAEQHGIPGRHVATADPRLGQRANKRHAFVLINSRQRSVKAGARRLWRWHVVDEGGAVGEANRFGSLHRPIASELCCDA